MQNPTKNKPARTSTAAELPPLRVFGGDKPSTIETFCITPEASIRDAIDRIDKGAKGIVLVVDDCRRLLGTITDGDIRRAILARTQLDEPLGKLLDQKSAANKRRPVVGYVGMSRDEMTSLLNLHTVHQLPILDDAGCVVDLVTLESLLPDYAPPLEAVIMAGGFGTRLQPLTNDTPKPMLPVGGRPLLEVAVSQLQRAGIRRVNVTTHYLPDKIVNHFGDGAKFGVELNYVNEESPLGTAGALQLLESWPSTIIVMNGDILTDINIQSMLRYHREHDAMFTVAVRQYEFRVPYGVVEGCDGLVCAIVEKPELSFFVNAGIYMIEPEVRRYIRDGERLDMPDLVRALIDDGRTVANFPVREYWLDIGRHTDYEQAQQDIQNGRVAA
ncbi:MAG: nucleotidyltransferase family protein [Pirellulales bacterium]